MTEKLKQTIEEELAQLPKEMQEAVNALSAQGGPASGWETICEEIGKKNNLDEEEINDFQLETLLVLIGVVDPEFYAVNIENHVNTTKDEAKNIAAEAFAKIFTPIGNLIEENIKRSLKNKNPNPEQTLNFILSGGDYSAFLGQRDNIINTTPHTPLVREDTLPRPDKGEVGIGF